MERNGFLTIDHRTSDSPFIERVWQAQSERAGTFLSVASPHCEIVVTRHRGSMRLTLRGPETRATLAEAPADAEWIGIRFTLGTYLTRQPAGTLIDRNDVDLPATCRSFWLEGEAWAYPEFKDAERLVTKLVQAGLLAHDPAVEGVLKGEQVTLSRRSEQRHFLRATGMSHSTFRKIERARYATHLLRQGVPIAEVVHKAGYYDQSHLTRSLKHLIGETPARIGRQERQLSFLYKTTPTGGEILPRRVARGEGPDVSGSM
jgi:AraC-like DNA-binding protein